jgi:hypothetical protein
MAPPRTKSSTTPAEPAAPAVEPETAETAAEQPAPVEPETPAEPEPESGDSSDTKPEDGDAPKPEDDASTLSAPAAPLEAPPEAPAKIEQPEEGDADAPQPAGNLGAALVKNAVKGSRLVDQATGEYPDPATLFERFGPGVAVRCTVRLCQDTWVGPHRNPIRQLVMPLGQVTSPEKAFQLVSVLRDQSARDAEGDDSE